MLSGIRKAEQVLPYFIMNELPHGMVGLVIAAAIAAAMSSLDSSINAISTVGIVDIYRRHFVKERSDQHYLRVAWLIAAIVSLLMIGGAILIYKAETKTLMDTGIILTSLFAGGLLGLYLLGFFTTRGDARAVWVGIIATMLFTSWTILDKNEMLPPALSAPFDLYYTAIVGNFIMFILSYFFATFVFRTDKATTDRRLAGLTVWS